MELMLRDPGAKLIPFRKLESSIPSCCRLRTPVPDLNADAYLDDLPGEFMNQAKKRKLRKKWSLTDYKEGDADLLNRWTEVAAFLREFPGEIDKAHISVLPPGNVLRVHQDGLGTDGGKRSLHDMFNRTLRFHVALRTTPESYLYADGELVQMKPGECWMINNMKYHSAATGARLIRAFT